MGYPAYENVPDRGHGCTEVYRYSTHGTSILSYFRRSRPISDVFELLTDNAFSFPSLVLLGLVAFR